MAANAARMAGRFASRARPRHSAFHHQARPPPRQPPPFSFDSRRSSARATMKQLCSPQAGLRREMASMLPLHNATAAALLVSLISSGSDSCLERMLLKLVSLDNFRPLRQQPRGR